MKPVFRLIGLPTDINSSFERGPALAPPAIREALWSDRGNAACENGMEIGDDFTIDDSGDLPLAEAPGDDASIRQAVSDSLSAGAVPILLGGDHAVTFPILEAVHARHGPVTILHFDAHPDLYDDFGGNPRSHASPFARIMERGLASRLVQVGIRTLNATLSAEVRKYGVEVVTMRDWPRDVTSNLNGPLYVSVDLDGLDPAFAPGVSHPEPGGLSTREVIRMLQDLPVSPVAADIVELNPFRDINGMTAFVAAKCLKELMGRMLEG